MPIHPIRTIYWMYRSRTSTLAIAITDGSLCAPTAIELRRIHAGREKENHDHGCGSSRGRQPEFADRGATRAGGLRGFSVVRKDGALQPGEDPGARGAC